MQNVLSTRLVRLVLDEWREGVYKHKVLMLASKIVNLRRQHKFLVEWQREWLCRRFREYVETRNRDRLLATVGAALKMWRYLGVDLRKQARIVNAILIVGRARKSMHVWVHEYTQTRAILNKGIRLRALNESRTLSRYLTHLQNEYKQRPSSLRFRLNLDAFKKYIPEPPPSVLAYDKFRPASPIEVLDPLLAIAFDKLRPTSPDPPSAIVYDKLRATSPIETPDFSSSWVSTELLSKTHATANFSIRSTAARSPSIIGLRRKYVPKT